MDTFRIKYTNVRVRTTYSYVRTYAGFLLFLN